MIRSASLEAPAARVVPTAAAGSDMSAILQEARWASTGDTVCGGCDLGIIVSRCGSAGETRQGAWGDSCGCCLWLLLSVCIAAADSAASSAEDLPNVPAAAGTHWLLAARLGGLSSGRADRHSCCCHSAWYREAQGPPPLLILGVEMVQWWCHHPARHLLECWLMLMDVAFGSLQRGSGASVWGVCSCQGTELPGKGAAGRGDHSIRGGQRRDSRLFARNLQRQEDWAQIQKRGMLEVRGGIGYLGGIQGCCWHV